MNIYMGGERITMRELSDNIGTLRSWRCRLIQQGGPHDGLYWKNSYNGYVTELSQAGDFRAESVYHDQLSSVLIELITPPDAQLGPAPETGTAKSRILISKKQANYARKEIGNKMCRWVCDGGGWAKKPLGSGHTWDAAMAQEFKVNTLLDTYSCSNYMIDMLDQEEAERISKIPVRNCLIEEALPQSLIDALRIAPTNETYHGLILKYAGRLPPPSITEFEKLKEWIEFNCDPKVRLKVKPANRYFTDEFVFDGAQSGRCDYTLPTTGRALYRWSDAAIIPIIDEFSPRSVDELLYRMSKEFDPWDYAPAPDNMQVTTPDGLSNLMPSDFAHGEWKYAEGTEARKERFKRYLQGILSREHLEQLGIAP